MIRTLRNVLAQDKEKFVVPSKVQDIIPVKAIWPDGIFRVGKNKYSKTYRFTDINYAVASREDKESMFLQYSEVLNSLDPGSTTKINVINRRLNRADFEERIMMKLRGDGLDEYREEYNDILQQNAMGANSIIQEKYVTISVCRKNVEDARTYFNRVGADLTSHFARLGSFCIALDAVDRLRIIHSFMRQGEESDFYFDIRDHMSKGHDFRDYICPDCYENHTDCFRIGDKYGRVLLLRDYASYISDDIVAEITDINRTMALSIDIVPVPTDEAVKEVEQKMLGVETNIANFQRKQNMNNNYSAAIPYDYEQQRKETREFLDDLITRDQRMHFAVITMMLLADTKEQLDEDTEEILSIVRKKLCQMTVLRYQQLDGLKTVLPYGVRKIDAFRTLTTESLAVFMPFKVQEVCDENGIYYGNNVISKNLLIADRRRLMNGNSFILGVSGAGKSVMGKNEIANLRLNADVDTIIIDHDREYIRLTHAFDGEVIEVSPTSRNHINAMELNRDYGDGDPVIDKSSFVLSIFEMIMPPNMFTSIHKSIADRCTQNVYRPFKQGNYMGENPTLVDLHDELNRQPEKEARQLALALELFTKGTLNTFAKQTNVDTDNSLICYDLHDLGEQLRPIGMLVVLDSILNRITRNRKQGRQTFIFIDECYLLFMYEYSAQFLYKLWKRVRKYGAFCTGLTQNVGDLLQSHTAKAMLANSEFIIMLNQAATDRMELAKLLNISEKQLSYITNVEPGHGLIKVGSSLVPFENSFPKSTKLYKLFTTKLSEVVEQERQEEFMRKMMEVAKNNKAFSNIAEEYLKQDQ